jgi:transporter family-2 protein
MRYLMILLAFFIGMFLPLQAGINNALKTDIADSTLLAAFVSFAVGTLTLLLFSVATGQPFEALSSLPHLTWWKLVGGTFGALFVFSTIYLAPRIGFAAMASLIITGQIVASLLMDRAGFLGVPVRDISVVKLSGAVLLIAGMILVNFGDRLFPRI